MAKIAFKKRQVVLEIEPPPLNLLSGKFRHRPRVNTDEVNYESQHRLVMRLIEDDSPIKRVEVTLLNARTKQSSGRYVMPVLFWEALSRELPVFMADVLRELERRGEDPRAFKRRATRGPN